MLDMVYGLPFTADKVRIKYGYFRKGFKQEANRTSNEHFVEGSDEKCYIKEIETQVFPDKKTDHFIYFQILVFHMKQKLPESVGWSVHKIHNKKNFVNFGQFQIPFYDHRLPLDSLLNDFQKSVGPITLCFSILPYDPEKEESPLRLPEYYKIDNYQFPELHQEERLSSNLKKSIKNENLAKQQIEQQRQKQLYEETFKEQPMSLISDLIGQRDRSLRSSNNVSANSTQNYFNKEDYDQYVRLSIDYNQNPEQLLQQIQQLPNLNKNSTIQEENEDIYE